MKIIKPLKRYHMELAPEDYGSMRSMQINTVEEESGAWVRYHDVLEMLRESEEEG